MVLCPRKELFLKENQVIRITFISKDGFNQWVWLENRSNQDKRKRFVVDLCSSRVRVKR